MTYRDEKAALVVRLDSLEREIAHTDGTVRGLKVVLAELDADARERARRALPQGSVFARLLGMLVGIVGGLATGFLMTGAGCFLASFASCGHPIEVQMRGALDASTRPLQPSGACIATVSGNGGERGACRARVDCSGTVVYEGRGTCGTYFDGDLVEYWDHVTDDGTPACFVSEVHQLAAIRATDWTVTIVSLTKSR